MRPDKQKQMMSYLTRPAKELIETGQVKFASDMVNPDPRKDVIEIDAINSFMKRNPAAEGGRMEFDNGGKSSKVKTKEFQYPVKFKNRKLLIKSLTHKSFDKENNNEKIEFLGDRVLGLVMDKKLLEIYHNEKEGILDKKFASLVNKTT